MTPPFYNRSFTRKYASWIAAAAVIAVIVALYRFAEPKNVIPGGFNRASSSKVGIQLKNVPFVAYSGGYKAWSLWAKVIDLERSEFSSVTSIQSAAMTDIKDGVLYSTSGNQSLLPLETSTQPVVPSRGNKGPASPVGPVLLRFHADSGHYYIGTTHPLPADLNANYTSRWQLILTGNVVITTRDGDSLHTEQLSMLGLTNNKTKKEEQRIECDTGAVIARKDVKISANRLRYALEDHTVELLDGVRASFKSGNIQSQRLFWSLRDDVVHIPDHAAGIMDGNDFSADVLTIDLKHDTYAGDHARIVLRPDSLPQKAQKR